jgi:predicted alpha/beta hydrolase family esterase
MKNLEKMVQIPKAKKLRLLHKKMVIDLRKKFTENMDFFFFCLDVFCKSLKRDKLAKETNIFDSILKCRERHEKLECIISKRFQDQKNVLLNQGEYQIMLKSFVKVHSDELKKFEEIALFFPNFLKKWIMYQVDLKIFDKEDFVNQMHKSTISDEVLLENPVLERCLVSLLHEKKEWSGKLREQDLIFKDFLRLVTVEYTDSLKLKFHEKMKTRYEHFIKEKTIKVKNFGHLGSENPMNLHVKEADEIRKTSFFQNILKNSDFNIENETFFQQIEWSPLLFQETFEKEKSEEMNFRASSIKNGGNLKNLYKSKLILERKRHLVVLVHGYGGSHYDMGNYKNFLSMIIPHSVFLASKSNEEMENKKINEMGKSLADEVKGAIKGYSNIGKVSFIGHSLGGVISRAALPYLDEFKGLMYSFVSLSSPHLGTIKNSSFLVNTGMFFLNKIKKDSVIKELQMNESDDLRESFMYNLAKYDKLHWFNNIVLVSSPQDSYVPYSSARMQRIESSANSKTGKILQEMLSNIWGPVKNDMIVRIDVDLRSPER